MSPSWRPESERFVTTNLGLGKLCPHIDRTFQLSQIVDAHRYLESSRQVGKVVVTTEEPLMRPDGLLAPVAYEGTFVLRH